MTGRSASNLVAVLADLVDATTTSTSVDGLPAQDGVLPKVWRPWTSRARGAIRHDPDQSRHPTAAKDSAWNLIRDRRPSSQLSGRVFASVWSATSPTF